MSDNVVRVKWWESSSRDERDSGKAVDAWVKEDATSVVTVGMIIHEGADHVVIARSIATDPDGERHYDGLFKIPRCAIIRVVDV